jgi:NTP pyrophosphatase (non-canonical NTP hydrolase)
MNELIKNVIQWGEEKGIVGPNGKATLLTQLAKTQEELTETRDAAIMFSQHPPESFKGTCAWMEIADGIGDQVVTLILAAELAGTTLEECLALAYAEIKDRTGKMVNGTFVKDAK